MRALKISLLVFILSITISAQQDNFLSSEKTLSTSFIIQTIDNLDQMLRQEVNLIINKLNNNHLASENYLIDSMISESVTGAKVKFLFEYNIDDKIIERTGFNNDLNGNWHLIEKDEYFYDTHYNLIREIYLDWNNAT